MNKFLITICFISILHFSNNQNISNDTIASFRDYFIEISKGMSINETNQVCTNVFIENKKELFELLIFFIKYLKGEDIDKMAYFPIIAKFSICNELFGLISKFTSNGKENIQEFGFNIMKKAKNIDKNTQKIIEKDNLNDILFNVGKIISDILNVTFK